MKRQRIHILALLLIIFILPARSQEESGTRLQWSRVRNATGYQVEIRPAGGGRTIRFQTETTYSEVSLNPGTYLVRISPVNKFGNVEEGARWQNLRVDRLLRAEIISMTPDYFDETQGRIVFTISGNNFRHDTRFFLERNQRRTAPTSSSFGSSGELRLQFDGRNLRGDQYTLIAVDRAGQTIRHEYPIAVGLEALAARNAQYPDSRQSRERSMYFNGVASNDIESVRNLLASHFNPNIADTNGFYGVHYAAYFGHLDMLKLLREYGAQLDAKDRGGAQPIHHASYKNREAIVRYLVGFGYNDVNALTSRKYAPLDRAALKGNTAIVSYLLSKGANVNHTFFNGESALHMAVYSGSSESVQSMLQAGASVNRQENRGFTPLHYSAFYSHADITAMLLENGANRTIRSGNGETPLDITQRSRQRNRQIIELLSRESD